MIGPVKIFILYLAFLNTSSCFAQFTDDFTDGDFSTNPAWSGDNTKFAIDNFQLRLQAPGAASTAYLSTASNAISNAEWEFSLRLEFNPSSGNYARIYLVSDHADLSGLLNGYFVIIGDTPDEVSLYRQSGSSTVKIVDGLDGRVNLSIVDIAIKVIRDDLGNWELFSDAGITGTYTSEGTAFDNTFNSSQYFGAFCNYTATRSDKFYFDDFIVSGNPYVDTDPPEISSVDIVSSNQLLIHFNEELELASASNHLNYQVAGNSVTSAILQPDQKSVAIISSNPFQNGHIHTLHLSGVKDIVGNSLITDYDFLFFQPVAVKNKDLIITEILADPSPQIGLPDAEYVELYNRSNNPFNLIGWTLTDGGSNALLPGKLILPGEYLIVTSNANVSKFGMTVNVLGAPNFPTLNNASDTLILKSTNGLTVDSLNYSLTWYRNLDKQEGGWSLELIDPANTCAEEENWTASENETGGTPGFVNSVIANKPDLSAPQLISAIPLSDTKLKLIFNEKLATPISGNAIFSIDPPIEITQSYFESKNLRSIILQLNTPLAPKQLFTITITHLFDCNGNEIDPASNQIKFALTEDSAPGDLLINEILFNPRPNGVDFVEIFNASDKFINIKELKLSNFNDAQIENEKIVSSVDRIIFPNGYLVFTPDPIILKSNYPQGKEDTFIKATLPALSDDKGSIAINNGSQLVVDYFAYEDKFHSQFLKDKEGVSLERISIAQNTNDKENWASAGATSGFATPGYVNSNFRKANGSMTGEVVIDPVIFAPNTGGADFSQINFHFDQPGFVANVKILDHQGRLIKTIANNFTLGSEGFFKWDGDTEDGTKARAGYYVVWFEAFNATGDLKTFRERVIISTR